MMGARRRYYFSMGNIPERYVVGWPEEGILKVGVTLKGRARWGLFLERGAVLLDLAKFSPLDDHHLDSEEYIRGVLSASFPAAFQCPEDARPYLPSGGGWSECYLVPAEHFPSIAGFAQHEAAARGAA